MPKRIASLRSTKDPGGHTHSTSEALPVRRKAIHGGNMATQDLLAGPLGDVTAVSQPGDQSEIRADRTAAAVMSGGEHSCTECSAEAPCPKCIHRMALNTPMPALPSVAGQSRGLPLPGHVRDFFEPHFGEDFGHVRVHDDTAAHSVAAGLHARAFTHGNDIYFARGEWDPFTTEGRHLLAHELAHVSHDADPTAVHRQSGEPSFANDEAFREFAESLGSTRPPRFGFPTSQPMPEHNLSLTRVLQASECPSACHQVARAHARYGQERLAAAARQRRLDQWPAMHARQHREEIAQQPRTLQEEITTGEMAAARLRSQLFDQAIGRAGVTEDMRKAWAAALQATLFLETIYKQPDPQIPDDLVPILRTAFGNYFDALKEAFRNRDREEGASIRTFNVNDVCPNCHRDVRRPTFDFSQSEPQFADRRTAPGIEFDRRLTQFYQVAPPPPPPPPPGPRERRAVQAAALAQRAESQAMWTNVVRDFRWATGEMDAVLTAAVPQSQTNRDLIEQLTYTRELLDRQRRFQAQYPGAVKVQAVFYPKPSSVADLGQRNTASGETVDFAKGIPWQFYMTHTPVAPGEAWPVDFEWQLHDITAARRDNRTVKTSHHIDNTERNFRMMGAHSELLQHPPSILQAGPTRDLFKELDHKDFFPEGYLYYQYPSFQYEGKLVTGEVQTNASATFWDWLRGIGMAIAILGSLVFAPFSTPMLVAVAVGTGLSIAGSYGRLREMEAHGVATDRDYRDFYWNVALDIVSALTLGVGRVAAVASRAGQTARAAAAGRVWFAMQRVEIGMHAANVLVVAHDFLEQYRAIERSNLSPDEKRRALEQLTAFGFLSGVLSVVPVAVGVRDLRRGATLHLIPDPQNPSRTIGRLENDAADELQRLGGGSTARGELLGSARGSGANRGHTYGVWSDGRVTRCSGPPCPDIAENIVERIGPLRSQMLAGSAHADRVRDLAEEARRLQLDGVAAAGSPDALRAAMGGLQRRAAELDNRLATLEADVLSESLATIRPRLADPGEFDRLLTRRLPPDLQVDTMRSLARVAASGDFDAAHLADVIANLRHMDARDLRRLLSSRVQLNLTPGRRVFHDRESIYWGRLRNSEEVSLLEANLRGYGASRGRTRSLRSGARGGTIAESSTEAGEHSILSLVGDSMPRQGLEAVLPTRSRVSDPAVRESLDIMVAERLHAIGAGLGAETGTGVAHGSSFVNQMLQRLGVENLIRTLHAHRPEGVRYIVSLDVRTVPVARGETRILERITYRVRAVEELPGGGYRPLRDVFEATITHPQTARAATRSRGRGDIQGIGIEAESGFGALAEHFGW